MILEIHHFQETFKRHQVLNYWTDPIQGEQQLYHDLKSDPEEVTHVLTTNNSPQYQLIITSRIQLVVGGVCEWNGVKGRRGGVRVDRQSKSQQHDEQNNVLKCIKYCIRKYGFILDEGNKEWCALCSRGSENGCNRSQYAQIHSPRVSLSFSLHYNYFRNCHKIAELPPISRDTHNLRTYFIDDQKLE